MTASEKDCLNKTLDKLGTAEFDNFLRSAEFAAIYEKFSDTVKNLEKKGPTSKLWIQYIKMITLVLGFIDAERSGNFEQHFQVLQKMIPIFFASGHHFYAKYSMLYLQQMLKLHKIMDITVYDNFVNKGYFTIRRSERFWSGVWSDMTIEQVLMRSIKCAGGFTRGRGISKDVIMNWVLARVTVLEICDAAEKFCGVQFSSSEQHVDNKAARISRDSADLSKIHEFLKQYPPFPETDFIVSIVTGLKGDSSVNCFEAFEIGEQLMNEAAGKEYSKLTYKRSSRVKNLITAVSTVKNLSNDAVTISPLQILQRLTLNIKSKDDMKEFICYELSPNPLSLFSGTELRKNVKSDFYLNFKSVSGVEKKGSCLHVVDGGYFYGVK